MTTKTQAHTVKQSPKHVQEDLFLTVYRLQDVVADARVAIKEALYEKADERMQETERMLKVFLDTHR